VWYRQLSHGSWPQISTPLLQRGYRGGK